MPGTPPETTHGRAQTKDTHPDPGQRFKSLTPPESGSPDWKAGILPTTPQQRTESNINKNNSKINSNLL